MKRAVLTVCMCLVALGTLGGCKGEDFKKQLEEKTKILAAKEAEIVRLKDDFAARENDLKNQMEQKIQKLTAQNKQQVDALSAKVAELTKKKDTDKTSKNASPKTAPTKTGKKTRP